MDVQDIELIRTIAEAGTLSQACLKLNMTQPTLSKRLARLEQVLGAELFHRYPRGLAPTDVARYILSKAEPLRAQITEIERHVELMTQLEQGHLNLGVGPIIEQIMLPDVLRRFVSKTGDVSLTILTEDEQTLLNLFAASELDIVVGPFDDNEQRAEDRIAIPMISDQVVAAARPTHPIFSATTLGLDELMQFSWVAPRTQGTVQLQNDNPVLERMKIRSENYSLLKILTESTDVICAGPRAVFRNEFASGSLREIDPLLELTWKSALLVKPETYATPLARELVSVFESAAAGYNSAP